MWNEDGEWESYDDRDPEDKPNLDGGGFILILFDLLFGWLFD